VDTLVWLEREGGEWVARSTNGLGDIELRFRETGSTIFGVTVAGIYQLSELSAVGCRLSAVGSQLSATGISYRSTINARRSAIESATNGSRELSAES
jgi:hypothetical protein